jgi:hypothetical protein
MEEPGAGSPPPSDAGAADRPSPPSSEATPGVVLAGGGADAERAPFLRGVRLRWLAARHVGRPLLAPRLGAVAPHAGGADLTGDVLAGHGFTPGRAWALLAATARPL